MTSRAPSDPRPAVGQCFVMSGGNKRKGTIKEGDVCKLLKRYKPTTILTLLHEVSQFADDEIDWKSLAKKTSTGISSTKEYRMLWRHLAYCSPLTEKVVDDGDESMDSDSDLEFELEVSPPVSSEASAEATAYVKVLSSSNLPSDAGLPNRPTVVAPMIINIPQDQAPDSDLNITIPVVIQKQSLPAMLPAEGNDTIGPINSRSMAKKKRKSGTKEEDASLKTAVQKFGESNGQSNTKEGFKHDVSPQSRWTALRGNGKLSAVASNDHNNSALTEAQLSTRQAISMALNMPMIGSLPAICSGKARGAGTGGLSSSTPSASDKPAGQSGPSEIPSQIFQKGPQKVVGSTASKSQNPQVKPTGNMKQLTGPSTLIQKAAIAAGGRIATPSTAASLFKAARSKNAVHIRSLPGAAPSISATSRSSNIFSTWVPPLTNSTPGSASGSSGQLPTSSSQPTPCINASQPLAQQQMEVQKIPTPSPNEAEDVDKNKLSSQSIVTKTGVRIIDTKQEVFATGKKVLVVNLDDGDEMDVTTDVNGNPELQTKTSNVLHDPLEEDNTCGDAKESLPSEAKLPDNATGGGKDAKTTANEEH